MIGLTSLGYYLPVTARGLLALALQVDAGLGLEGWG